MSVAIKPPVSSSALSAIAFKDDKLYVWFKQGKLWCYENVTHAELTALLGASSIGSHFSRYIKGQKKGCPMDEEEPWMSDPQAATMGVRQASQAAPAAPANRMIVPGMAYKVTVPVRRH